MKKKKSMHTIQFNGERLAYKTEGIINAFECVIIIWTRKYISLFLQRANSAPKHGICSVDIKYSEAFSNNHCLSENSRCKGGCIKGIHLLDGLKSC